MGDNSLLEVITLIFYQSLKIAPEIGACIPHCAPKKIFKNLLDLGHQLNLGIADRAAGIVLNHTLLIVIHGNAIGEIRLEMRAGEVVEILFQPHLTPSSGMYNHIYMAFQL